MTLDSIKNYFTNAKEPEEEYSYTMGVILLIMLLAAVVSTYLNVIV